MRQHYLLFLLPLGLQATLATAQAGMLDPTLANDGTVNTDVGASTFDEGNALRLQPDGRILVAGTSGYSGEQDFGVVRYLIDGDPDPSFGTDGRVRTSIFPSDDVARSIALQNDGAILVGGYGSGPNGFCFALVRYDASGQPDPGFGDGGIVTTDLAGGTTALGGAVAVLGDGKILLAGGGSAGFAVVRYLPDGTVDDTFGTDGLATVSFAPDGAQANAMAVQGDGKIVLAGYASGESVSIAVARLNSDGTPDTGFSDDGRATAQVQGDALARALTIDPDGRIVVAGNSLSQPVVARFTPEGVLDATLNGNGIRPVTLPGIDVSSGYGIALEATGKILVAGSADLLSTDFLLVRLNDNGTFDFSFNGTGFVTTDFSGTRDAARAVAVQTDGHIVLAGLTNSVTNDYDFALARYFSDGATGIAASATTSLSLAVRPSPLAAASTITYALDRDDRLSISLVDMRGACVQRFLTTAFRAAGRHEEPLLIDPALPPGAYLLVVRGEAITATMKVEK